MSAKVLFTKDVEVIKMSTDIMSEWPEEGRPSKLLDKRGEVPRHTRFKWGRRSLTDIKGLCIHQTLGGDDPVATANYHVNYFPNGSSTPGAPSVCYTFYIRRSGDIWMCNDIEDITWSQGNGDIPGDENLMYLAVVLGGNFNGTGYSQGVNEPTLAQMNSLLELINYLCVNLGLGYDQVLGHYDVGKPACPGYTITSIIEALNRDPSRTSDNWSIKDWQYALVRLGYDLGAYGPRKDGVDGDWGTASKVALVKYQTSKKLQYVSGIRDLRTKALLVEDLKVKFGVDVDLLWS